MNEKLNKNVNVEHLTKMLGRVSALSLYFLLSYGALSNTDLDTSLK